MWRFELTITAALVCRVPPLCESNRGGDPEFAMSVPEVAFEKRVSQCESAKRGRRLGSGRRW